MTLSKQTNFICSENLTQHRPVSLVNGEVVPTTSGNLYKFLGVTSLGALKGQPVALHELTKTNGAPVYIDDPSALEDIPLKHCGIDIDQEGHTKFQVMSQSLNLPVNVISYNAAEHLAMVVLC